jgi:hypothetical protein
MSNQQDVTKFEFVLTLDGNIICQRFFNVKNHNPESKRSINLHNEVKIICEEISEDLKIKSSDFLCENLNYLSSYDDVEYSKNDNNEYFLLEIKQDDDVFISRIFPAFVYHPKVRYTVDIRPRLKDILSGLTDVLSLDVLETNFLGYDLQTN